MDNQPHILVIGAGVSGLAATSRLIENGFENITVLEAENRIGGRLHSINFDGTIIDLGAQWVHGEKDNTVYRLVKDLDLIDETTIGTNYDQFTFYTSDNTDIDQEIMNRLVLIAMELLEDHDECEKCDEQSVKDYFLKRYYKKILIEFPNNNQEIILQHAHLLEKWLEKMILCYEAAESWNMISIKQKYKKCEGNQLLHWKGNGYTTFLDVLMRKHPKVQPFPNNIQINDKIFLNKKVNKITWKNNENHPGKITVQCSNDQQSIYHVDHVISTVSIAVLKEFIQLSVFNPELPKEKSESIDIIPLGTVMKIYVKFPQKWWPDNIKDFSFLWSDMDKEKIIEEFSEGVDNGRSWLTEIFGFYTIDSDPNVLEGWCVGPMVKNIEMIPDNVVKCGCNYLFQKFLGSKFKIPEIKSIHKTTWGTNPNFQGTFSYVNTIMADSDTARLNLIEPLRTIDGEATHLKYFSTVHGAVETGYREADRLIDFYQKYEYHKIAIIGAGMAGLGAATKLIENNIDDFVVLESQAVPGGRISTISLNSKALDLGAQWIHGKDNPVYELAKKHDLLSEQQSEEGLGLYIRSNGEIVDKFIVNKAAFIIGQILDECSKFTNSPEYPETLAHFLYERYQQHISTIKENIDIYNELYDWHDRFQIVDNSCSSLKRLSAKSWGEYVCIDDIAHYNLKNGYQSLIDVILMKIPNDKIRYNSDVIKIKYKNNENIEILLNNGRLIRCNHLILTPSLGVIKSTDGLREILPIDTQNSIDLMGYDGVCKIFLIYDHKWWKDSQGLQLLWNENCKYPEKDILWLRQISGFEEVFNHPNVLIAWISGEIAVRQVENLEPDEIGKQCTNMIRKFLPNWPIVIPLPKQVIRTNWLSNRYIKGSYCHITPECDNTNYGIRQLSEPIEINNMPRILLAGEAINPLHYSTTHGAYESGMEQAEVLIDYIKKKNKKTVK